MIRYPQLKERATIGVTAPSSGVRKELHHLLTKAKERFEREGHVLVIGDTVWTQDKAKSAPAMQRAIEFTSMMQNPVIDMVLPPWGGELLIEILEHLDFDLLSEKWVLGYSDTSLLLFAMTLKTGIATAHGANLVDLRGEASDDTTALWKHVLMTQAGDSVEQHSSAKYQREWSHENPTPIIFHLTEQTDWKTVSNAPEQVSGRLLGGCIDIIRNVVGTPFGDVATFQKEYLQDEPILWYFENCDMETTDLRRALVQMKLAGWFANCSGVLFGRSDANGPVDNYTIKEVYADLAEDLGLPVIYDIDCGHVPPQVTLINGAYAEVEVVDGKGKVLQKFI
ncbi:LD-carboxypeptidase [Chryseomicrobium excrementi]|uniref:LD-carboxypeptidase n=1 Tax=Chryseomicrobium excrementi TaxID=2041346 RepID=A0A2M9EZ98_9BACL|nr:S66 peptidase family protein [Chryseomicrobium excrementi]PJK16537.1 LD-carboxypeptidase [Chryseomicrobium excrementi]